MLASTPAATRTATYLPGTPPGQQGRGQAQRHQQRDQVKPSYGLTDGEIAKMLKDSFQYAGDDKVARVLREQQVDAQRLLEAVQGALDADGERLLDAEERMVIDLQMRELAELMKGNDGYAIEQQTKRLSQVTDAFAARRMDQTVKAALAGRNLNEIEE